MYQTRANNQSTELTTYAADAAASLTQALLPEPALGCEFSYVQESHPTPGYFSLPGSKNYFLFSAIHDSKGNFFTDKYDHFLVASTYGHY